ncbi:sugar ABC transporter permease [Salinilacihabitans rarus]|uniref:sugar ABC transporter permease n=1 Tax=Salinilacihabitans rarus TaxID=2961596 RepID=UPI0020C8FB1E|nr:ABC transporter permease subunit [Salinilacihabitans rarus]
MTLLGWIARKIRTDVESALNKPADLRDEVAYTVEGIREGTVDPLDVAKTALSTVATLAFVVALLFPVVWILGLALQGEGGTLYSTESAGLLPGEISPEAFLWVIGDIAIPSVTVAISIPLTDVTFYVTTPRVVFLEASAYGVEETSDFWRYLKNSLAIAIPTVLIALALIVPGAYAFSRRQFVGRMKILYGYVLFTQIGGGLGIAALIALYTIFVGVGAANSRLAMSIYYAALAVPFNTWLLKTYMDSIPVSYEEAAIMDGASPFRVAWEVVLPLAKPGLATIFIFIFLTPWMEFIVAQTVLQPENYTLPVGLFMLIDTYSVPWGRFSAFALLYASPIVFIYLFAQRYIESGLSFGGMEG